MKKTVKVITTVMLCVMLGLCVTAVAVITPHEDNTVRVDRGTCNADGMIKWTLTEEKIVNQPSNFVLVIEPADDPSFSDPSHPEYRAISDYTVENGIGTSPWTFIAENPANNRLANTLTVANGIEQIGTNAFYGHSSLNTVTLYPTLKTVKAGAFSGCNAVTRINFYGTRAQWEEITFESGNGILANGYEQLKASGILRDICSFNGHTESEQYSGNENGHYKVCKYCGETLGETVAHTLAFDRTKTAASCTAAGEDIYRCTVCGYESEVVAEPLGHNVDTSVWMYDAASHFHKCTRCDHTADSAPHTLGDWTVDTVPTAAENGRAARSCTVCGYTEYADIAFIPGDVNCDGTVDETDADLAARYAIGLLDGEGIKIAAGDVNGDGVVNVLDCVKIMLYIEGKITSLGNLVTP